MGRVGARSGARLLAVLALAVTLVGCFPPDNIEFRRLDNVPYHPANAADLVVGSWAALEGLAGQAPAVADRVVDVHRSNPAPPAGAPVIVWVPGGAWVHHNQSSLPEALERYVNQGWVVVTVGYTRADAAVAAKQWPVQGHEIDWVVRWVKANATALGVSADKVVLAGHSAGAHLSAQVASARFDGANNPALPAPAGGDPALSSFSSKPAVLVLLAGAYNLTKDGVPFNPGAPALGIPPHWPQQALLGCDPGATPLPAPCAARIADASVVHAGNNNEVSLGHFPPTFIVHGEDDTTARFGENSFHLGLQLCNNTYTVPGGPHTIPLSFEVLADDDDHAVTAFDYAKLDYFLFRRGLLASVPVAATTWTCNQP